MKRNPIVLAHCAIALNIPPANLLSFVESDMGKKLFESIVDEKIGICRVVTQKGLVEMLPLNYENSLPLNYENYLPLNYENYLPLEIGDRVFSAQPIVCTTIDVAKVFFAANYFRYMEVFIDTNDAIKEMVFEQFPKEIAEKLT